MNLRLFLLCILMPLSSLANDFNTVWYETQAIYTKLINQFAEEQRNYDQQYLASGWQAFQSELSHLILGQPDPAFLHYKTIQSSMIRVGYGTWQTYELNYIRYFLSPELRSLFFSYQDTNVGGLSFDIPEINCCSNSMAQMYVLSKVLENKRENSIASVLEWGAGFGSLARVTKSLLPNVTYFMVDLLPFISLQYLYLKSSLPGVQIKVHYEPCESFEPGFIHLIPLYLFDKMNIRVDAFISMFALTECPYYIQNKVIKADFFGASALYVSGITHDLFDSNGTRTSQVYSTELMQNVKKLYTHYFMNNHYIYETGSHISHFELVAAK
jgi:hypothetical protein